MKFFTNQKSHYESLRASDDIDAAAVAMQLRKRGRRVRSTFVNLLLIEAVHLVLFVGWMGLTEQIHVFDDKLSSSYRSLHEYSDRALFDEKNFQSRNTDDVLWKSLFPDAQGIISIPKSSKLTSSLMPTRSSPLDPSHSLFQVSIFHHLHCLEMIKDMLIGDGKHKQNHNHESRTSDGDDDMAGHSMHCIDWIRQALMCTADLTLDPTDDYLSFGQDSEHKCRNFGGILEWTQEHRYKGSLEDLDGLA